MFGCIVDASAVSPWLLRASLDTVWTAVRSHVGNQTTMLQVCAVGVLIALSIIWWRR